MNEFLSVIGSGYEITPSESAKTQKAAVLANAQQIATITSPEEMEQARGALNRVKSWLSELEGSRELAKKPFLVGGRFVDDVVRTFGAEILTARTKLETQIKTYAREQEEKRQAAERERLRLEREAERARQELELAEKAKQESERLRLEEIRKKGLFAAAESVAGTGPTCEMVAEKKIVADQAQASLQQVHSTLAATGPTLAKRTDFEISDIHALYGYDRSLVELAPKRREILQRISLLKTTRNGAEIPGVKIIEDFKV